MYKYLLPAAATAALLAGSAQAATLDADYIMNAATTIVLGDLTPTGTTHLEGPGYVGGNLTSGTFDANTDDMPELDLGTVSGGLIVGGNLTTNLNSAQNGTVQVGGTYTGNPGTETVVTGADVPVAEMAALFTSLSTNLATLDTTVGASLGGDSNNPLFTAGAGGDDGIAILNLDASTALSLFSNQNANPQFDLTGGATGLIINVAGDLSSVAFKINNDSPDVLFNFYETVADDASDVFDFGGGPFNASVLAPFANVKSASGGMNGTMVAGTLDLGGEIRPYNNVNGYAGGLPGFAPAPPSEVPVPAALPLLAAGLGALGLMRRRA